MNCEQRRESKQEPVRRSPRFQVGRSVAAARSRRFSGKPFFMQKSVSRPLPQKTLTLSRLAPNVPICHALAPTQSFLIPPNVHLESLLGVGRPVAADSFSVRRQGRRPYQSGVRKSMSGTARPTGIRSWKPVPPFCVTPESLLFLWGLIAPRHLSCGATTLAGVSR